MRRHIHRLKPVNSGEMNLVFNYQDVKQQVFFFFKKRQEYKMFEKARLERYCKEQAQGRKH